MNPCYYAIIPANVRYCKELEPNAKLLYGEITALCSVEGYCWAKDKYFSDLYQVDEFTISRWLRSLKELGFIVVDTQKKGFKWDRKIWICPENKIILTNPQKCGDRTHKNVASY